MFTFLSIKFEREASEKCKKEKQRPVSLGNSFVNWKYDNQMKTSVHKTTNQLSKDNSHRNSSETPYIIDNEELYSIICTGMNVCMLPCTKFVTFPIKRNNCIPVVYCISYGNEWMVIFYSVCQALLEISTWVCLYLIQLRKEWRRTISTTNDPEFF